MSSGLAFKFEVQSLHPYKSALDLVDEIRNELPAVAVEMEPQHGPVSLEAEQAETFPIDPATVYLVVKAVSLAGATGAATKIGAKLGEDLYDALKARVKNARIVLSPKGNKEER